MFAVKFVPWAVKLTPEEEAEGYVAVRALPRVAAVSVGVEAEGVVIVPDTKAVE